MLEAIEHGVGPAAFAQSLAWALLEVGAGERIGWQGIDLARTARRKAVFGFRKGRYVNNLRHAATGRRRSWWGGLVIV